MLSSPEKNFTPSYIRNLSTRKGFMQHYSKLQGFKNLQLPNNGIKVMRP